MLGFPPRCRRAQGPDSSCQGFWGISSPGEALSSLKCHDSDLPETWEAQEWFPGTIKRTGWEKQPHPCTEEETWKMSCSQMTTLQKLPES